MNTTPLLALTLGLTLTVGRPALAQTDANDERAHELYENGAMLYEEGRYEDAIVAWQTAWELSQRPLLLYNIANAQERAGQWREALETLNRYRAHAAASERDKLDRRISNLERRLADAPTPVAPPPAVVTPRHHTRWTPIVLYGVGAAGLATGTAFAFRASSARAQAKDECVARPQGWVCPATSSDTITKDRVSSLVADSGFIVAGLATVGGTVALLLDTRGLRLAPLPGGICVRGRF